MRIAVAMPAVPFMRGGTELLSEALVQELRRRKFTADLVTLPYKWYPPERLILDAVAWRQFDFTEAAGEKIDRLICTKFPSYLAQHPNKVLWLYHQYRQVYDRFGEAHSDVGFDRDGTSLRDAVMALDAEGLRGCRKICTISKNVSRRLQEYNGVSADTIYPPPRGRENFRAGPFGDYILYVGRLDPMKRVDLLVHAATALTSGRILIAGRGEEHDRLQGLIDRLEVGDRVKLLGFVEDSQLYDLYAEARGVYYAPIDEDYGLTTVEAMLSHKPVITFSDSGGVLEFVIHERTGLVCESQAAALADASNRLLADAAFARRLGEDAFAAVRHISWDPVIAALLDA